MSPELLVTRRFVGLIDRHLLPDVLDEVIPVRYANISSTIPGAPIHGRSVEWHGTPSVTVKYPATTNGNAVILSSIAAPQRDESNLVVSNHKLEQVGGDFQTQWVPAFRVNA